MPRDPLAAARTSLAARQAAIVAAVLDGTAPPPAFAPSALVLANHVVTHKRGLGPSPRRRLRRSLVVTLLRLLRALRTWANRVPQGGQAPGS